VGAARREGRLRETRSCPATTARGRRSSVRCASVPLVLRHPGSLVAASRQHAVLGRHRAAAGASAARKACDSAPSWGRPQPQGKKQRRRRSEPCGYRHGRATAWTWSWRAFTGTGSWSTRFLSVFAGSLATAIVCAPSSLPFVVSGKPIVVQSGQQQGRTRADRSQNWLSQYRRSVRCGSREDSALGENRVCGVSGGSVEC
jgi:hypothetical protein